MATGIGDMTIMYSGGYYYLFRFKGSCRSGTSSTGLDIRHAAAGGL
jgi:hypothetical protein